MPCQLRGSRLTVQKGIYVEDRWQKVALGQGYEKALPFQAAFDLSEKVLLMYEDIEWEVPLKME